MELLNDDMSEPVLLELLLVPLHLLKQNVGGIGANVCYFAKVRSPLAIFFGAG